MTVNIRRLTGLGTIATLALAALVFGCVLAATAGPREAANTSTQALRQTIATFPAEGKTITVSASWSQFMDNGGLLTQTSALGNSDLTAITGQLRADSSTGPVQLAPASADWAALTTNPGASSLVSRGLSVKLELSLRTPDAGYLTVLRGSLSVPAPAARANGVPSVIGVAVTKQTAAQLRLTIGSRVPAGNIFDATAGKYVPVTYEVAAIVAEKQPGSAFWQEDPSFAAPTFNRPTGPAYWVSGMFALDSESTAIQDGYGANDLTLQWVLPLNLTALTSEQAQPLDSALVTAASRSPALSAPFATAANNLTVSTDLQQVLATFLSTASSVDVLLWLVYVSLAVAAAAVLLLAARMVVTRRTTELALRRARGGSLLQAGLAAGRGALISCVPAAVAAGVLAVALVPGPLPPGGWWPGITVLVISVLTPAVLAAWQQRLPRSVRGRASGGYSRPGQPSLGYGALGYGRRGRRRLRIGTRLVVEAMLTAAAVAGIVVFRQQGLQTGSGVNYYTSAAPVLVAIPAVIVVLRLYPLVLRALLRAAARTRGATGFLGLARAARTALTPALPALTLVLAITVAAFAGMVRDAVTQGETSASWQTAGADITISGVGASLEISPAAQHALATVPGVNQAAAVAAWQMTMPNGSPLTALAVSPAAYSALVASGQSWPAVDPSDLEGNGVLVSPQALAAFGRKTATLTGSNGVAPLRVRVTGTLSGTPALTAAGDLSGDGAFAVMSDALAAHEPGAAPNVMLLNGPGIDTARAVSVAGTKVPGAVTVIRSGILGSLTGAPVQRGAFGLLALALVVAAVLGLAAILLQLALSAADREATLARLATMGLGEGQRVRLALLEVLPSVIAAAVAAIACALALPSIVGPAIDLSVFTGSGASVRLVPDTASFTLPLAGLIVVCAVALTIEIRARRTIVATLRGGDLYRAGWQARKGRLRRPPRSAARRRAPSSRTPPRPHRA